MCQLAGVCNVHVDIELTWSESSGCVLILSVLMLCTDRSDGPKMPSECGPLPPRPSGPSPMPGPRMCGGSSSSSSSDAEPINESVMTRNCSNIDWVFGMPRENFKNVERNFHCTHIEIPVFHSQEECICHAAAVLCDQTNFMASAFHAKQAKQTKHNFWPAHTPVVHAY